RGDGAAWFYCDVTACRTSRRTTFDFSDMVPSRVMRYSVIRLNPAARATEEMLGARLPIRSFRLEYWMNLSARMISASLRIGPYARAIGAQASHGCPISYWDGRPMILGCLGAASSAVSLMTR